MMTDEEEDEEVTEDVSYYLGRSEGERKEVRSISRNL